MTNVYIGVDQTGAVNRKGQPKPLPACSLIGDKIQLVYLNTFSKKEIMEVFQLNEKHKVFICVDCVIGLPTELNLSWREALEKIKDSSGYGLTVAQKFFHKIGQGQKPRRKIEILCHANSVFTEKPFQKNIQTGTYRLWKDISQHENDFYAPYVEGRKSHRQLPLFEGYPSFSWKILFESIKREPQNLHSLLKIYWPNLKWSQKFQLQVNQDPNLADALVLALTLKKYKKLIQNFSSSQEGWILGYTDLD